MIDDKYNLVPINEKSMENAASVFQDRMVYTLLGIESKQVFIVIYDIIIINCCTKLYHHSNHLLQLSLFTTKSVLSHSVC